MSSTIEYKLAVVIPCWNCKNEIAAMLDSILLQGFSDWKLFCVDDQSTDNTQRIIKDYAEKDHRIHLIIRKREPKGAQTCRNIGLELSKGAKYVMWLDSDDLIASYCFEQRVLYMDSRKDIDFGIFPAKTFVKDQWEETDTCYGFPIYSDSLKALLTWTLPMVGWTNIYRRESIVSFHLSWDERLLSMQDSDFNIQAILKGLSFAYAYNEGAKVDYFYRVMVDSSITSKLYTDMHFQSHLYLLNKITESLSSNQKTKYKANLEIYFLIFARLFKYDKNIFIQFLKIRWVKENPSFRIRLIAWRFLGFHFTYKLFFRRIHKNEIDSLSEWKEKMKSYLTSGIVSK